MQCADLATDPVVITTGKGLSSLRDSDAGISILAPELSPAGAVEPHKLVSGHFFGRGVYLRL